jgi:hypothetical protein
LVEIPLTKGKVAIVDDCDSDLAKLKWCENHGYAARKKGVLMHRVVLERILGRPLEQRECVDHINKNRADNRRCNIRLATNSQNQANRGISRRSSTGFKGAYLDRKAVRLNRPRPYKAMIRVNGKAVNIGNYATSEEAAKAYDQAAIEYFGEYAETNF